MRSEADTRANFIDPALATAGWGPDNIIREHSWTVPVDKLKEDYDLSAKNPAKQTEVEHMPPAEILKLIQDEDQQVQTLLAEIGGLLEGKK